MEDSRVPQRHARRFLVALARAGYAARGVVYLIIGSFAITASLGGPGRAERTDSEGALVTLLDAPFGEVLLGLVAIGLLGHALWRTSQSLFDADHRGRDLPGLFARAGQAVSAMTHVGLAVYAVRLLVADSVGGGSGARSLSAQLLQQTWGPALLALIGLCVIGGGIAQIHKGWTEQYRRWMPLTAAPAWTSPVCRFGLCARGAVFAITGGLLVTAAWKHDPSESGGLREALRVLQAQPYGDALFLVVALGLFAFGVYSWLQAVYRRVDVPPELERVPRWTGVRAFSRG
jgi:hypothetical protein